MTKILALVVALSTVSAFAGRKLVTFDSNMLKHYANYVMDTEETKSGSETEKTTLGLHVNMAWEVKSQLFVGGILYYVDSETETGSTTTESNTTGYGLRVVYELSNDAANTMYGEFRYIMENEDSGSSDQDNTYMTFGFGKRFGSFAELAGANVSYSPSIEYTIRDEDTTTFDSANEIRLNLVKFDVLF